MPTKTVRMSLDLSPEANELLESLSNKIHGSKSEVLRRAIVLLAVAVEAKEKGQKFGVASPGQDLKTEILVA